jgi:hypothetical protein
MRAVFRALFFLRPLRPKKLQELFRISRPGKVRASRAPDDRRSN